MKKNCLISVCIFSLTFASVLTQVVSGQNLLTWIEIPSDDLKINDEIPDGKALFVFDGEEDFNFESDATLIEEPKRDGSLYKFLINIEPSSGGITIKHKGIYSNNYIPWGKNNLISLPPLKNKEVRIFKLSLFTTLDCHDITSETIKRGSIYTQARYEKEALIILNVVPVNLNLTVSGSEITDIVTEEGIFKIYVNPVGQHILLKSNNYDDYIMEFDADQLQTKEVRYYHVQPPPSTKVIETFDANIKNGSYTIESTPVGALIQIICNKAFNEQHLKTPYTLEYYKEGKEIITIALDRYETIMDTILIGNTAGNKSTYNLIPNFAFINFNVEPAIPISKVLMDGKELSMIENGNDYECPKGFHIIEFDAPGFYSDIRQVSFVAGKTHEMDVRLKPNTSSATNSLSNGQTVGADYQPNVARYQPAPTSKYYRSTWTVNQRTPAAAFERSTVNQRTPEEVSTRNMRNNNYNTTSTVNQLTPAEVSNGNMRNNNYNKTSTVNQRTSSSGYNRTQTTKNLPVPSVSDPNLPSTGYNRSPTTGNQGSSASEYNRSTTTGNQSSSVSGYNRSTTTGNQSSSSSGYNRSTTTGNQNSSASGYNRSTTTGNQKPSASGYNRTTTTVNKKTPVKSTKKYYTK